ncbi:hypothetical protein HPB50_005372 [Hyalomma asiaticum]|uniref:Uncharacterized protein n=1 Tax=Hyalomma asiaticum TaxID=266040 RepID=A0ACB7RGZ0_HYAAI|nr:hypothetical protein HPB50_005372 [Hyalomma asiaticum]
MFANRTSCSLRNSIATRAGALFMGIAALSPIDGGFFVMCGPASRTGGPGPWELGPAATLPNEVPPPWGLVAPGNRPRRQVCWPPSLTS